MSLLEKMHVRSTFLSLLEIAFFFGVVSVGYFFAVSGLWLLIADPAKGLPADQAAAISLRNVGSWIGLLPVWMSIVLGVGYILLVTIYWAPGDEVSAEKELRAFEWFVLIVLIVGGIGLEARYRTVSSLAVTFWKILTTGSGS